MDALSSIEPMYLPQSVEEALAQLANAGPGALPVAGATWVMRAPLRHEPVPQSYVALSRIGELRHAAFDTDPIWIGALVTHDRLVRDLPDAPDLRGLITAAGSAANPGVRRLATLGGNLGATGFAAADLVPALMGLDAEVEVASTDGRTQMPVEAFLATRNAHAAPRIITGVSIPRTVRIAAHVRSPMRKAGDYPAAIVSLSAALDPTGRIEDLRVAVGAVEAQARRWHSLEAAARGQRLGPSALEGLARDRVGDFEARNALDAPAWYRLRLLPTLVRRAFSLVQTER